MSSVYAMLDPALTSGARFKDHKMAKMIDAFGRAKLLELTERLTLKALEQVKDLEPSESLGERIASTYEACFKKLCDMEVPDRAAGVQA
jgi:hypothetical protein